MRVLASVLLFVACEKDQVDVVQSSRATRTTAADRGLDAAPLDEYAQLLADFKAGKRFPRLWRPPGPPMHQRTSPPPMPRVTVVGRAATVSEPEVWRRLVRQHYDRLSYCYERELLRNHGAHGEALTVFWVNEGGEVTEARVSGLSPRFDKCTRVAYLSMDFSKYDLGAGVITIHTSYEIR